MSNTFCTGHPRAPNYIKIIDIFYIFFYCCCLLLFEYSVICAGIWLLSSKAAFFHPTWQPLPHPSWSFWSIANTVEQRVSLCLRKFSCNLTNRLKSVTGVNSDFKKYFVGQLMTYSDLFDNWAQNVRMHQMLTWGTLFRSSLWTLCICENWTINWLKSISI